MLTSLRIQNFKGFDDVTIELGQTVVFIGPNNSGKTTALQALALWYVALETWRSRSEEEHYFYDGEITINRNDLTATPVPATNNLWRNLQISKVPGKEIEEARVLSDDLAFKIHVEGVGNNAWLLPFEFHYTNAESLWCVVHIEKYEQGLYEEAIENTANINIAFLPPMSGLTAVEDRLERGSIQRRIGEGRTAEVLRNLCFQVYHSNYATGNWDKLRNHIRTMFGVELLPPNYRSSIGTLEMSYVDRSGVTLDLSASGRGMLQILLLLSYLYTNPGAVLLLDEPDAHLEILRQREVYQLLTSVAREQGSQIIAASHSEVVLEEAADLDTLVAFVGKPHRIDDRSHRDQVRKAIRDVGFTQYYQAEQIGWALYLEGATDLSILQTFAATTEHAAKDVLQRPFVNYVSNQPKKAEAHFQPLRYANPAFIGFALFDRLKGLPTGSALQHQMWQRNEIENYLMYPEALIAYATDKHGEQGAEVMRAVVTDFVPPIALRDPSQDWWSETKASDKFLTPVFKEFYKRLELPNLMDKTDFHQLAAYVPRELIDPEVTEKLDAILAVASAAKPRRDNE